MNIDELKEGNTHSIDELTLCLTHANDFNAKERV